MMVRTSPPRRTTIPPPSSCHPGPLRPPPPDVLPSPPLPSVVSSLFIHFLRRWGTVFLSPPRRLAPGNVPGAYPDNVRPATRSDCDAGVEYGVPRNLKK